MEEKLEKILKKIKEQITEVERNRTRISETDTRNAFINPIFRALGWNFGNFAEVRSEFRHKNYNDAVDYAFFSEKKGHRPVLLLEAKTLGTDLNTARIAKQLGMYMGEMGVQWGVISDGNRFVMYNASAGKSFEDKKFLTLVIKDMDTEDGITSNELAKKMIALLSRESLENDDIQATYEQHMMDTQIQSALQSLMASPFDTLARAIRSEFKEERVNVDENLRIPLHKITEYLEELADDDGQIPLAISMEDPSDRDDELMLDIADSQNTQKTASITSLTEVKKRRKRIAISDLLEDKLIHEGDNWRFHHKGEIFWGRITGNGELEVNGVAQPNPSRAAEHLIKRACAGWNNWEYKDEDKIWQPVENLRAMYREAHGLQRITRKRKKRRRKKAS